MTDARVSVIITAHNYAEYLERCLDSAINQTFDNHEVVVVNDGSTDETPEILREYSFEYPGLLTVVRLDGEGLPAACNAGIEAARGEYIIRLDADDYFDENILTVEAEYLDSNPDVDLVYPDYYTIDDDDNVLDHVHLPTVGSEVKLLNRSPLAAGAMYRKSAWHAIGGYNESLDYQEDYDFWIRFINEFTVANVNLPLMYYRQHDSNMSDNLSGRLESRRQVKKTFVETHLTDKLESEEVLGIIPARDELRMDPSAASIDPDRPLALQEVEGHPLLHYTIDEARATDRLDRVILSTDDEDIATYASEQDIKCNLRPAELADPGVNLADVVDDLLTDLRTEDGYRPDITVVLPYISPCRTASHVDEAVDSHLMFSVDSVISVTKNRKLQWQPGKYGLEPLFDERLIREEREVLYEENGALYVFDPEVAFYQNELVGDHVGHILMEQDSAVHIDSELDLKLCRMLLAGNDVDSGPLTRQ